VVNKSAKIIAIDPARPEQAFSRCRQIIASGGVIIYPTDTFYGLGADPGNKAAVQRLFLLKGRKGDQPILLLLADASAVDQWAAEIPARAEALMNRFWPGPLTLVFKARSGIIPDLTANTGTIGLRVPGNPLTRNLLQYLGCALTGTSANLSGRPEPRSAEEAAAIADLVDAILDGGPSTGDKPSTVIDVSAGDVRVIREGAIPTRDVKACAAGTRP
jgi:L-threonylcarbamoyladenylate synthase